METDGLPEAKVFAGYLKHRYGPNGKNFIAHVEIPVEVKKAFAELCQEYSGLVWEANPLYASKN